MPYRYYYDLFTKEFSAGLGFGLPKTDCCNDCSVFASTKKELQANQQLEIFQQVDAAHKEHLKVAEQRRNQMEIDYGAQNYIDPQTHNVVIEHDETGGILETYGPASIFIITPHLST